MSYEKGKTNNTKNKLGIICSLMRPQSSDTLAFNSKLNKFSTHSMGMKSQANNLLKCKKKQYHKSKSKKSEKSLHKQPVSKSPAKTFKKGITHSKSKTQVKKKCKLVNKSCSSTLKKTKSNENLKKEYSKHHNNQQYGKENHEITDFFLYRNNYIPIQNSAQRRFVIKLNLAEQTDQSTAPTFYREDQSANKKDHIAINTQEAPHCENAVQTLPFKENVKKCFTAMLTELQFLYLPEQSNFQNFSEHERQHYKKLLQTVASKLQKKKEILNSDIIHLLLYQRQWIQNGMLEQSPNKGFPTHINTIASFLQNLVIYVKNCYKEPLIQRLHMIYKRNNVSRLADVRRGIKYGQDQIKVIGQDVFENLEHQLFEDYIFNDRILENSVHCHNKAIFDSFNQQLNKFRPFYKSDGEPFPWHYNLGITFYVIDETALSVVFYHVKRAIFVAVNTLAGLHIDYDQYQMEEHEKRVLDKVGKCKHRAHIQSTNQRISKLVNQEIKEIKQGCQQEQERLHYILEICWQVQALLYEEGLREMDLG